MQTTVPCHTLGLGFSWEKAEEKIVCLSDDPELDAHAVRRYALPQRVYKLKVLHFFFITDGLPELGILPDL